MRLLYYFVIQKHLAELWTSLNVRREQIEISWRNWVSLFGTWLRNVYGFVSHGEEIRARNIVHHKEFFSPVVTLSFVLLNFLNNP